MFITKLFTPKCKKCKTKFPGRKCLKYGKDICYECCNETRTTSQCPEECAYSLNSLQDKFNFGGKTDSISESENLLYHQFSIWKGKKFAAYGDKTPMEHKKEAGDKFLREILGQLEQAYVFNNFNKIYELLEIDNDKRQASFEKNYEKVALDYINTMLSMDYAAGAQMLAYPIDNQLEGRLFKLFRTREKYFWKGLKQAQVLRSAMTKEKNEAVVEFFINKKVISIFLLFIKNRGWVVAEKTFCGVEQSMERLNIINRVLDRVGKTDRKGLADVVESLENLLELFPDNPDLHYNLGTLYLAIGQEEKGKTSFDYVQLFDRRHVQALYNLGVLEHFKGDAKLAEHYYDKVLEIDPGNAEALNNMGTIRLNEKDYDNAHKYFMAALRTAPGFDLAKNNLKRLEQLRKDQ